MPTRGGGQVLAVDDKPLRTSDVNDHRDRLFVNRRLARLGAADWYRAGTGVPGCHRCGGGEGQQRLSAIATLDKHRGHLRGLIASKPVLVVLHLSEHSHNRDQQPRPHQRGQHGGCCRGILGKSSKCSGNLEGCLAMIVFVALGMPVDVTHTSMVSDCDGELERWSPVRSVEYDARRVIAHAEATPARLGNSRLIVIDGPAGSGKSTLAEAITSLRPATSLVVHLDDLYPGWGGMSAVHQLLPRMLQPMAAGWPGHYRHFDWYQDRLTHSVVVPHRPLVIVEGCASGLRTLAHWTSTLVWVEAPRATRWQRGQVRGGVGVSEHWRAWSVREDAIHQREATRSRADLVLPNR